MLRISCFSFFSVTTIRPNLGIIEYNDSRKISVADLPGLIEGAHANVGKGHKFLKHLDRTKLLLFMVDVQGFRLSEMHNRRSCLETIIILNKELELYKPDLLSMPAILIINKMDTDNSGEIFRRIEPALGELESFVENYPEEMRPQKLIKFEEIITSSLILGEPGEIQRIKDTIRSVLDRYYEIQIDKETNFSEADLVERIKRSVRQRAPTLV